MLTIRRFAIPFAAAITAAGVMLAIPASAASVAPAAAHRPWRIEIGRTGRCLGVPSPDVLAARPCAHAAWWLRERGGVIDLAGPRRAGTGQIMAALAGGAGPLPQEIGLMGPVAISLGGSWHLAADGELVNPYLSRKYGERVTLALLRHHPGHLWAAAGHRGLRQFRFIR